MVIDQQVLARTTREQDKEQVLFLHPKELRHQVPANRLKSRKSSPNEKVKSPRVKIVGQRCESLSKGHHQPRAEELSVHGRERRQIL